MQNIRQIARIILRNKRTTLLVLISLSIGLTAYILISAKVIFNKSYDTYLDNYKNIYRIVSSTYTDNILTVSQPRTQRILGQMLETNYQEVKQSGFLCRPMENIFKIGDNSFTNDNSFHCSAGFTKIFSIKCIQGNSSDLLTKPNMVIISESFAKKFFGTENPVGKMIYQYPNEHLEIEAVYEDFPVNSHIRPDFLISFHDNMFLPPPIKENWGEFSFYTYLELNTKSDISKLENEITSLCRENNQMLIKNSNSDYKFSLQAIEDIHTKSQLKNEIAQSVKGEYLDILYLVSIFILIVSGFNYVYFSYTRITGKSLQYGIKKTLGAKNITLLSQFITESLFIHVIALFISILTVFFIQQTTGVFDQLIHFKKLPGNFWTSLFLIITASTVFNPLVLLLMLRNKNTLSLLTKKFSTGHQTLSFRQVFTIVQFAIIVFLISSIIGISKQVYFLKEKDKGIQIKDKLIIKTPTNMRRPSNMARNLEAFELELTKISGVQNVAMSNYVPGDIPAFVFSASVQKEKSGIKTGLLLADNSFLESVHINMVEGMNFKTANKDGCIINSTCMKQLGCKNPEELINKKLYLQDESAMQTIETSVIGVCEDFNFTNVKESPSPIIIFDWSKDIMLGRYTLTVDNNIDKKELLSKIKLYFYGTFPNYPFEYFWLEDFYNKQYDEEHAIIDNLKNLTLLAIVMGILSMLSMVWHLALSKTKEIGIRKVNGAKRSDIIKILNFNFLKWIGVASIIAIPASWYFLSGWLSSFAYRTNISIWIFLVSAGVAFFIGIAAITLQSLKAAAKNPVESLKYE